MDILEFIIDTIDYRGIRVVLTERKWKEKLVQHPELLNKSFLASIEKTLKSPDEVWEDYSDPKNKTCSYKKYSQYTHTKVIVWITQEPNQIVSSFETNYIKETKYPKIKRIR